MERFSERYHAVNALSPVADAAGTGTATSRIINLAKYGAVTFILTTGVTTTANGTVTVLAGTSISAATNAVAFKYRSVLAPGTTNVPTALTDATSAGFSMTASKADSMYEIEVDGKDLLPTYSTCKLVITEVTNDPQVMSIVAILGHPRYEATQDGII